MELNVWTSSTVTRATPSPDSKWTVDVVSPNRTRTFSVGHVVFATGFGGGQVNFPVYPGMVRLCVFVWECTEMSCRMSLGERGRRFYIRLSIRGRAILLVKRSLLLGAVLLVCVPIYSIDPFFAGDLLP
jgi:hypothetical protein